ILVKIYTDGASKGNPGPGAYAVILQYKGQRNEFTQGFRQTTNNRMELLAVIAGLEALKQDRQQIAIYSDSKYVVDAVEKGWLKKWLKAGFKGKKNIDLWKRFWKLYQQHQVTFYWVRGHTGDLDNERCDRLAVQRIQKGPLAIDEGYEYKL
ncbi:MAG: ribonuclease HI, partial [Bacteroidota bacterium]